MEAIKQTWSGNELGTSGSCTSTISRNGDLVHRMYLEVVGTAAEDKDNIMAAGITDVELEIGGQKIDKHTGQWMNVWDTLQNRIQVVILGAVTKNGTLFQNMSGMGGAYL